MLRQKHLPNNTAVGSRYAGMIGIVRPLRGILLFAGLLACTLSCSLVHEGLYAGADVSGRAALPPVDNFFREPEKTAFTISPDGTHVAWLAPWRGYVNVHVTAVLQMQLNGTSMTAAGVPIEGDREVRCVTSIPNRDVHKYYWIDNENIAFLTDVGGDGNSHLYLVPRDGGTIRDLTPFAGVKVEVIDTVPYRPDEILIAMNQRDPVLFDAYRLAVSSGRIRKIAENPGSVFRWTADHDGKLRAAVQTDGLRTVLWYRNLETEAFRTVYYGDADTNVHLHGFTFDNRNLLLVSNMGRDKEALVVFDPTAEIEVEQLYAHPEVDVLAPLLSDHRHCIEGAVYIADRVGYAFFDGHRQAVQAAIDRRFPGLQVDIVDRSRDEKRLLILVSGDRYPGTYYTYDAENDRMEKLTDLRPWLNPERLATVDPVAYPARDGQLIHGYLTLPAGIPPRDLPVVVLPHGNLRARDLWGYHPESQFIASRGYAVFQPNFRGSSGYGRAFKTEGFRQWGIGVMQNDISDGVVWLVEKGIAAPKRIAIYGASYGGYAALAGLTFTPELYAAGVSFAGPANLFALIQSFPLYKKVAMERIYLEIGDPKTESSRLIAASPLFHTDRIRAPLLVAQGATDPRVKKSDIDKMVYLLRRRGIHVSYMVKENEGHRFKNKEDQMDFYRAMEAFLARYIGGRSKTSAAVLAPLERQY